MGKKKKAFALPTSSAMSVTPQGIRPYSSVGAPNWHRYFVQISQITEKGGGHEIRGKDVISEAPLENPARIYHNSLAASGGGGTALIHMRLQKSIHRTSSHCGSFSLGEGERRLISTDTEGQSTGDSENGLHPRKKKGHKTGLRESPGKFCALIKDGRNKIRNSRQRKSDRSKSTTH